MNRCTALLIAVCCLLTALSGCATVSVRHLERTPWQTDSPESLQMKFFRFDYTAVPVDDGFGVRGVARLDMDRIPQWAGWMDEVWFEAYMSDRDGEVVARDLRVMVPRPLGQGTLPFEFILRPESVHEGPLYLSFGYRLVLSESRSEDGGHPPFFASEGAITQ